MYKHQIPTYSTLRTDYVGRYIVMDPYMKGTTRFGVSEGTRECILKGANSARLIKNANLGNLELVLDTSIKNVYKGSYVIIGKDYYRVSEFNYSNNSICLEEPLRNNVSVGTEITLFSVPVEISSTDSHCTSVEFGETNIEISGIPLSIVAGMTVKDVVNYYIDKVPVTNFGDTLYFYGVGWSDNTKYDVYDYLPLYSKMILSKSSVNVFRGDELVLYHEDIRGNYIAKVEQAYEQDSDSGKKYLLILDKVTESFEFAQLRAYPAYKSKRIPFYNIRPCIGDVCSATTFGDESIITSGIRLYNNDTPESKIYKEDMTIPNLYSEPSDLWFSKVIEGSIIQNIPDLIFKCNEEGVFQCIIDAKLRRKDIFDFNFSFSAPDTSISFMDYNGNFISVKREPGIISSHVNNVILTIHSLPYSRISLDNFSFKGAHCTEFEYYFVCKEKNNSRVEANSIHLKPVFKPYKELLAIIGSSKVGEGRIAL